MPSPCLFAWLLPTVGCLPCFVSCVDRLIPSCFVSLCFTRLFACFCLCLLVPDACFALLFPCCFSFLLACFFVFLVFCSPGRFVRLLVGQRVFVCICWFRALLILCCFSFLLVCFLAFLVFSFPELLCQTPRRSGKIPPRCGNNTFGKRKTYLSARKKNLFRSGKNPFRCKKILFAEAGKIPAEAEKYFGSGKNTKLLWDGPTLRFTFSPVSPAQRAPPQLKGPVQAVYIIVWTRQV